MFIGKIQCKRCGGKNAPILDGRHSSLEFCRYKIGQTLERSAGARGIIRAMGLENTVGLRGVYTGKSTGKYTGCIRVRVEKMPKAEPFNPDDWQAIGSIV